MQGCEHLPARSDLLEWAYETIYVMEKLDSLVTEKGV